MDLQGVRLNYAPEEISSRARQVCPSGSLARSNFENKIWNEKKGERDLHTPHSGVLRSQEEKKTGAGAYGGSGAVPVFATLFDFGRIKSVCGRNVSQHG
jgi:hypothetical protein